MASGVTPRYSLAVYCGSRTGQHPSYADAACQLGRWMAANGVQLVYGGGGYGLMGTLASEVMTHGGSVVGIIPQSMVEREWAHQAVTELVVVQSMHERKAAMVQRADAMLAISGGIGTLDEFFEAWTWRQLGYHNKPVGLLNTGGYYDGLIQFLQHSVREDFLGENHFDMLEIGTNIPELPERLLAACG